MSESWVYFIQAGIGTGPIKIGRSTRPVHRLRQLQTAQAQPLRGLGVLPERVVVERQMHVNWAPYHLQGEWFSPHPNLIGYIRHHADPWPELTDVTWSEETRTQLRYLVHWHGQTPTECLRLLIAKAYGDALNVSQTVTVQVEREPENDSSWLRASVIGNGVRCPRCRHRVYLLPDDDPPERCPRCHTRNVHAR